MDRRQAIIVIAVLAGFIVVIAGTALLSQRSSEEKAAIKAQRFRTKQEKQVAKPTPLYSNRDDRDEKRGDQTAARTDGGGGPEDLSTEGTQQSPDLIAKSIAEKIEDAIPATPLEIPLAPIEELSRTIDTQGEAIAVQAATELSPEEGLAFLTARLAVLPAAQASIDIYTTAAAMYMRIDPPAPQAALDSLRAGAAFASTPEDRGEVALAYANYLIDVQAPDRAAAYLENALAQTNDFTDANVRAWLLLGAAREANGNDSSAIAAFLRARDDAASLLRTEASAESLYREACMRLARAYRAQGDQESATRTAQLMHEFLARTPKQQGATP